MKLYTIYLLLLSVCSVFVSPCAKATPVSESVIIDQKSPYTVSAAEYLAKAQEQTGQEKQASLLLAAGRLISEGLWTQGLAIVTQTKDLTPRLLSEKKILLAQIDMMNARPEEALVQLHAVFHPEILSLYQQIQFHELLAQAYQLQGKERLSIMERITLDKLISDPKQALSNKRNLWRVLIHVSTDALRRIAMEDGHPEELNGWVQLVLISRAYQEQPKSLLAALDQWKTQFNNHPANDILPEPLDSIAHKMMAPPQKIALLLPLTGPFSGPGHAIIDGFLAAYKASEGESVIEIKKYDTNKGEIEQIYQKAIDDGADYIVGPLIKNQVARVATMEHPVPTLLLNDANGSAQENSYTLSLSPTEEAMQVAIKARSQGHRHALVIAPQSPWGNEIAKVFSTTWTQKGGEITDGFFYSDKDLNTGMKALLQINESEAREKQTKQLLGQNIQFVPSRRHDFDMIFLLAYPSKARQIMPLLKYYYAADVPVYATSSVYAGNANALKDKDLDGLIFCDIPWVFAHQMGVKNWPEQFNSYNRLYALGMDSYALSTGLNQLILFPADGTKETTGTLYLKSTQQVARVFEWGQFKQGLAHSLGEMA